MPVPSGFDAAAEDAEACKKSGRVLPPRARHVHGELVLGFDHYCSWLGVPIGLHNRRFFVQYLLYSALLCAFAGSLAAANVAHRAGGASLGREAALGARFATVLSFVSPAFAALMRSRGHLLESELVIQVYAAALDGVGAAVLGGFGGYHLWLVRHNATTLDPADRRFDLGARRNWRQVFGAKRAAWVLPLWADGPGCDGVAYPRRAARALSEPREASRAGGGVKLRARLGEVHARHARSRRGST